MFKVKNPPFFLEQVFAAMVIEFNSVISRFSWEDLAWLAVSTIRSQVSDYSQQSDYIVQLQLYRMISEQKSS